MVRISFNSSGGTLKILEAKTINRNKVMKVSPKAIEIKPLASAGQGFDAQSQATIAYPDVNVGSKIFLKYQKEIRPSVPGLFTYES
ncbi:MAG: DUF3857 domain-containing protein, partial [Bdellovibrio sp.]|nr:DUF3857 domain-containing protein [Bdellovibrio sp.]